MAAQVGTIAYLRRYAHIPFDLKGLLTMPAFPWQSLGNGGRVKRPIGGAE